MRPRNAFASALILALISTTGPASAITARDVMDRMGKDERWGYLTGLIDMMSYQEVLAGNDSRAQCIVTWFYDRDETIKKVFATFLRYGDKAAEGILVLMARKACGVSDAAAQSNAE